MADRLQAILRCFATALLASFTTLQGTAQAGHIYHHIADVEQ
jgi:hypothetical protein